MLTTVAQATENSKHLPLRLLIILAGILWPEQARIADGDCFDYIIIGSGAGSIVANRLTEDKDISVLVIEAGNTPSVECMVPGLIGEVQNSYQDWQCKSEKEPATKSQSEDVFKISLGKSLGGSSCINHFIYLRGNPSDYNYWAEVTNDSSWKYDSILPYFTKAENVRDENIMNSEYAKFHSTKGPIVITKEPHKSVEKYLKAFDEVGKKPVLDLNGNDTVGYILSTLNIGNKVRQSLAQAYINPIVDRANLHVSYNTLATKINFDDNNNAVSVNVIKNGKQITMKAAREVILCAGVIKTPQLLMLSGIGPKEHLESFNIPVIENLPVGQNLQDHVAVQLVHKMEQSLEISEMPPLTKLPFPIIIGNVNMNRSESFPHYQSLNAVFAHDMPYLEMACTQLLGYKNNICQKLYNKSHHRNTFFSLISHLQPKSRGEVKLRSSDPKDCPIISENFYSDERDLNDVVSFIGDFIGVIKSKYFKEVKAELLLLEFDDCVGNFSDINYIRCYAKHMSATMYHQTSTCPMGTVLDSQLRVKGVNRLRVVDASAFPRITKANTLASVVMLAEKGSDMIKKKIKN